MDNVSKNTMPSRAFTLVELLTVIVIIGILAGLIVTAAFRAIVAAKNAAIRNEIGQLDMALQEYKAKVGAYPPDFWGINDEDNEEVAEASQNAVLRHLRMAYPRYEPGATTEHLTGAMPGGTPWERCVSDLNQIGISVRHLSPATALPFWLGGLPGEEGKDSTKLVGLSANALLPFLSTSDAPSRRPSWFDFDETRLRPVLDDSDNPTNVYCYHPKDGGMNTPYVYFRRRMMNGNPEYGHDFGTVSREVPGGFLIASTDSNDGWTTSSTNVAVPYLAEVPEHASGTTNYLRKWANPKTFQILSAGLDGEYGVRNAGSSDMHYAHFRVLPSANFPGGANLSEGDRDNLTNFLEGRLEDTMP